MRVTDIQTLFKLLLSFMISLLPLYTVQSQATDTKKVNKISVKLVKTVNGKTVVTDTVIVAEDYAKALSSLRGLEADTAMLRRMKGTLRNLDINIKSDTALFKRLHGDQVRVLEFRKHLDSASIKQMNKRFKVMKGDSVAMMRFKDRQFHVMGQDSLHRRIINRNIIIKNGDTIRYEKIMPGKSFEFSSDSTEFFRIEKDGDHTKFFRRIDGDRILIEADSLVVRHSGDGQAVERHIYVIKTDEAGNHLFKDSLGTFKGEKAVRMFIKTKVTEVPDAEREKLKSAGNKVESKKKEKLEIENINFYPNPNAGRFKLAFNLEQKGDVSIRVLDNTGQEIYSEKVKDFSGNYNKEIDLSGVSKGIYYLQVAQGKRFATRKIVIQ